MAGEVALSPSQVKKDGQWRPIRHKTAPSYRPSPPLPIPRRLSSVTARLRRRPLSTINEDQAPSLKTSSTASLKLKSASPYQSFARTHSTEHLIHIQPSRQLQAFQSVSYHSVDEAFWSTPRLYRMQSQWTVPPESHVPSEISVTEGPTAIDTSVISAVDAEYLLESVETPVTADEDLPREAIADLFQRVEEYEREHPENPKDAVKVWIRASEVSQGLTKTLKTMGSLSRRPTSEARPRHDSGFGPSSPSRMVPIRSQIKIYEKPTQLKRMGIAANDYWRRFRNWSTGRDTELQPGNSVVDYTVMDLSVVSFILNDPSAVQAHKPRKLSRAPRLVENSSGIVYAMPVREESRHSGNEQLKRRKSSLFLDVDS